MSRKTYIEFVIFAEGLNEEERMSKKRFSIWVQTTRKTRYIICR